VDVLHSGEKLIGNHQNGLQRKMTLAKLEKILQGLAKEIHDQDIVIAFGAVPPHIWDADAARDDLVNAGLVEQLWRSSLGRFEFDRSFFLCDEVLAGVDFTEGARAKSLLQGPRGPNLHIHNLETFSGRSK
jgi:hypothetical protein